MPKKGECDPIKHRYWRKVLADWHASGLFAKEFCIKHNVHYNNFINWRKRLPEMDGDLDIDGKPLDTVSFAPVRMIDSEESASGSPDSFGCSLEIALPNGIVLRLSESCSMKLLSSVVSLLGVN